MRLLRRPKYIRCNYDGNPLLENRPLPADDHSRGATPRASFGRVPRVVHLDVTRAPRRPAARLVVGNRSDAVGGSPPQRTEFGRLHDHAVLPFLPRTRWTERLVTPGDSVKAPVRAVLMSVGFLATNVLQHPGVADAAPFSTSAIDALHHWATPKARLLVRAPALTDPIRGPQREDDAAVETEVDDDAAVAGSQDYRWTAADVLYVRDRASVRARCIIDREIGGFGYDPWRRGAAGERGPVQLHPRGLLPEYVVWSGGQAPENPYYAVAFLEYKLRQGQARHWSPVRLGLC